MKWIRDFLRRRYREPVRLVVAIRSGDRLMLLENNMDVERLCIPTLGGQDPRICLRPGDELEISLLFQTRTSRTIFVTAARA